MSADLAGRATVQIVEAGADMRDTLADRATQALRAAPDVRRVERVAQAKLIAQLEPWLGEEASSGDLPIPALIDVALTPGDTGAKIDRLRTLLQGISPAIRIEPHAAFLQPLSGLLAILGWLAAGIVLLMTLATGAVVVLAARSAHDSHRRTIEVLHLMGATDVQIARLFQRRIALDATLGTLLGFILAVAMLLVLEVRLAATGSEWLGAVRLDWISWLLLAALPLLGIALSTVTARWTVLRALGRSL